jgi:hypothetical protein
MCLCDESRAVIASVRTDQLTLERIGESARRRKEFRFEDEQHSGVIPRSKKSAEAGSGVSGGLVAILTKSRFQFSWRSERLDLGKELLK